MNRTDRLFAVVLELQRNGRQRAEDLVARFETSKRTIYRDIQALCETGVPVVSLPGQGYALAEGYFLPPLSFSSDEATMLLLGADLIAQNFDSEYRAAAISASRKIEAVLSDKLRKEVSYLQSSIRFIADWNPNGGDKDHTLRALRRAVIERKRIRFIYHTRFDAKGSSSKNLREADPYGLCHSYGVWYLFAYCHLRRAIRNFRLDRIHRITILDHRFERPANFKLEETGGDQRNVIIRALFDKDVAVWVREWPSYYITAMEDVSDGLMVEMKARSEREVLQWLLGWGARVRVLAPESLKRLIVEEAGKVLDNHRARC